MEKQAIVAHLLLSEALADGWTVHRCHLSVRGSIYLKLRHPDGDRLKVRVSDHKSPTFRPDGRHRCSVLVHRATLPNVVECCLHRLRTFPPMVVHSVCVERMEHERVPAAV